MLDLEALSVVEAIWTTKTVRNIMIDRGTKKPTIDLASTIESRDYPQSQINHLDICCLICITFLHLCSSIF